MQAASSLLLLVARAREGFDFANLFPGSRLLISRPIEKLAPWESLASFSHYDSGSNDGSGGTIYTHGHLISDLMSSQRDTPSSPPIHRRHIEINLNTSNPRVLSMVLAMFALSVITFCIASRAKQISWAKWRDVSLARWLVLGVYCDSWAFVFSSSVLQNVGLTTSPNLCDTAILMCLVFYLSSKVILYFFLVERVWIVQGGRGPRFKDALYLFNSLGMLFPYCMIICLTFVFRRAELLNDGQQCKIGLKLPANIPLLVFDFSINIFLTALFLRPLRQAVSSQTGSTSGRLRAIARRTFFGSACTLCTTLVNLVTLLVLKGSEPGWLCFAFCNADVLISALVLHWVTGIDHEGEASSVCRACKARLSRNSSRAVGMDRCQYKPHRLDVISTCATRDYEVGFSPATGTSKDSSRVTGSAAHSHTASGSLNANTHYPPDLGKHYRFGGVVMTECRAGDESTAKKHNPALSSSTTEDIISKYKRRLSKSDRMKGGRTKSVPATIDVPMGRISCRTETTQDRTEVASLDERLYIPKVVGSNFTTAPPAQFQSPPRSPPPVQSPSTIYESEHYHPDIETGEFPTVLTGPARNSTGAGVRMDICDFGDGGIFGADLDVEEKGIQNEAFEHE